uniref:GTP-binding protein n=1 Tax=Ciona savignyi TaxID=51511 RepID=H2ZLX3_CIOSA
MTSANRKHDQVMKILVIGDTGVGKTQFVNKFARDQFEHDVKPTVGVEYVTKTIVVKGHVVCLHIWDLAGRDMFRSITNAYYSGAVGALIVYDITKIRTFDNTTYWFENLASRMSEYIDCPVTMLVGNKVDLRHQRSVPSEAAIRVAKQRGASFVETSALTGSDVTKALHR